MKTAFAIVLAAGTAANAQLINDYESYVDQAALDAVVYDIKANTTATLDLTGGVGGSQGLLFASHNGNDPWFGQFTMGIAPTSLTGVDSVDFAAAFIAGGSNESFKVELLDSGWGTIAQANFGLTQAMPTTFTNYTIDTSFTGDTFFMMRFTFVASDYGPTSVMVDDVYAIVPAPASMLAFAGLGLIARRRR